MTETRGRSQPIGLAAPPTLRRRSIFARAHSEPLSATASGGRTLLNLFGVIGGDGISADSFRAELAAIDGDLTVRIHSPGGDVFDGVLMHNLLAAYSGNVRVEVPSLAASAASIVAMAGDVLAIGPTAHLMIHSCWSVCVGPARDMRKEAEVLDSIDRALVDTYAARTGIPAKQIAAMLVAETWILGPDAVARGWADELLNATGANAQAGFDLSIYQNTPAALKTCPAPAHNNARIESRADLEHQLRSKLGLARSAARKVAATGWPALAGGDQSEIDEFTAYVAARAAELKNRIT